MTGKSDATNLSKGFLESKRKWGGQQFSGLRSLRRRNAEVPPHGGLLLLCRFLNRFLHWIFADFLHRRYGLLDGCFASLLRRLLLGGNPRGNFRHCGNNNLTQVVFTSHVKCLCFETFSGCDVWIVAFHLTSIRCFGCNRLRLIEFKSDARFSMHKNLNGPKQLT